MSIPAAKPGAGDDRRADGQGAERPQAFGAAHILKGIDLEVAPREVCCLIGPSGSGKSTFLRCINHLEQINAGRLWVDGDLVGYRQRGDRLYELRDREVAAKRRDIGMVFQRFNLFPHMTAIENVMEAPVQVKRETRAVARSGPPRCSNGSAWPTRRTATPPSCPAASSSGWPSPGRWPWSPS